MEVDDGQLIDLVRQFPIIWDSSHKHFKNRDEKANAWRTIGQIMNLDGKIVAIDVDITANYYFDLSALRCETRWISLRTIYGKEKKKVKYVPSGSAPIKEWEWLTKLNFLDNHIRRRKCVLLLIS